MKLEKTDGSWKQVESTGLQLQFSQLDDNFSLVNPATTFQVALHVAATFLPRGTSGVQGYLAPKKTLAGGDFAAPGDLGGGWSACEKRGSQKE